MRVALYAPRFGMRHTPESLSDIIIRSGADLFAGAEYLLFYGDGRRIYPLDQKVRKAYLDALCAASKDCIIVTPMLWEDGRRFYNSAPIIHDGRIAGERYKRHTSVMESVLADMWGMRFAPTESKPVTTVDGIDLRVEICLDFPFISDKDEADMHILCASGFWGDQGDPQGPWRVKDGGNALVVDNQPNSHDYWMSMRRRVGDKFIPHTPRRSTSKMHIYEVDV